MSGSPAGPESGRQFTDDAYVTEFGPVVLGIVVDDVDDAQGEEARARAIGDLHDALMDLLHVLNPVDPAHFEPIDVRVVLAFPSYRYLDELQIPRFVSWPEEPELRWHEDYRRAADVDRLVNRVQTLLQTNIRTTDDNYMPIATLHDLTGRVYATFCAPFFEPGTFDVWPTLEPDAPSDDYSLLLAVFTGRDDFNTPLGVLSWENFKYVDGFREHDFVGCYPLYGLRAMPSAVDVQRLSTLAREIEQTGLSIDVYDLHRTDNPLWMVSVDGWYPECNAWPYGQDAQGNWSCRREIVLEADSCDAARGWRDPINSAGKRVPTFETQGDRVFRVCEIDQLTGADRERCETDFECQDCAPGWCITTLPELRLNECSVDTTPWWQFRFVGPSNPSEGQHRVKCME